MMMMKSVFWFHHHHFFTSPRVNLSRSTLEGPITLSGCFWSIKSKVTKGVCDVAYRLACAKVKGHAHSCHRIGQRSNGAINRNKHFSKSFCRGFSNFVTPS